MKKSLYPILLLTLLFGAEGSWAEKAKDLAKTFPIVSVYYSAPDNDQRNFADVVFRFAWTSQKPFRIAIQFVNHGYADRKLKFAIKDVTSKKTVILDPVRHSPFGTETLKANSTGGIWSGPVDNINDSFSLRVWDSAGDEFDKVPISSKDQQ